MKVLMFLANWFISVMADSQMVEFSHRLELDGFTCPLQDGVFKRHSQNVMACSFLCVLTDDCHIVFYHQDEKQCTACMGRFSGNTGLLKVGDSVAYSRIYRSVIKFDECYNRAGTYLWRLFDGNCYSYVSDSMAFDDAMNACNAMYPGIVLSVLPVLAVIESKAENDFVLQMALEIDKENINQDGILTGSILTDGMLIDGFYNYHVRFNIFPEGTIVPTGERTCIILLDSGDWGFISCEAKLHFICKFSIGQ